MREHVGDAVAGQQQELVGGRQLHGLNLWHRYQPAGLRLAEVRVLEDHVAAAHRAHAPA